MLAEQVRRERCGVVRETGGVDGGEEVGGESGEVEAAGAAEVGKRDESGNPARIEALAEA